MTRYLLALLLASLLPAQTVLPPGAATQEGFASDGDTWSYRTFRASCRYPAAWVNAPLTIRNVAWRGDATRPGSYDRLRGWLKIRAGAWLGDQAIKWSTLPMVFDGYLDPPAINITKAWEPQPFNISVPLMTPVVVAQGGIEIDAWFAGPYDPIWFDRVPYWVDAHQNPSGGATLSDMWLDTKPPYMGCAGWPSETRTDRVPGKITMEVRSGRFQGPAVIAIGMPYVIGCYHVNPAFIVGCNTDSYGVLQLSFPQPGGPFAWAWQAWVFGESSTESPDRRLASGHWCVWSTNGVWPCQTIYAYKADAAQPSFEIKGAAWVVELR